MTEGKRRMGTGLLVLLVLAGWAAASSAAESVLSTKDLETFEWRSIGPWTFSGRITDFAVPGGQSQVYYVATASGGVWKTEDGGIHFEPVFDQYGNMSIGNIETAPSDPDIVYMGTGEAMHARSSSHGNGMWKSTDAGKTWTHIGLEESYFIPRIAIDASNPDIVYVAAEGKLYSNDMDCQRGLYKTVDGGETWDLVLDLKDRGVGDFVIDPSDSNIVIAAAYKTYRRTWTFIDRQPGNHLYKTVDGGKTWKKLTQGLPQDIKSGWNGLALYAKNPSIVYFRLDEEVNLGLNEREGAARFNQRSLFQDDFYFNKWKTFKPNARLAKLVTFEPLQAESVEDLIEKLNQKIEDKDFQTQLGIDWDGFHAEARRLFARDEKIMAAIAEAEKTLEAFKEAAAKGDIKEKSREGKQQNARVEALNRHVLELLYAGALAYQEPVIKAGVIYRSDDQGETWVRRTDYSQSGGSAVLNDIEAGYAGRIEVDPNNPDVLYAVETISKVSEDGGETFKNCPWFGRNKQHVDVRGMWVDPLNSLHILVGNDGGVSETWDGGKHWSQKDTISAQQFYDIAVDQDMPYNVMGGTQDNGCWFGPSRNRNSYGIFPSDWVYLPSGDGYYVLRNWWNPEYVYFESQFGNSSRINFKTGEITRLSVRNTEEEQAAGKPPQRYQWDAPIVLSPHNPGIVYVCSQHVHRSYRRGDADSWETVSPDLSRADKQRLAESKLTNLQYATIYTFAESPAKPGVYWAGTDDGNLQLSRDHGENWTNITFTFYRPDGKLRKGVKQAPIPFDRWVTKVEPSVHKTERCYVTWSGYRTHSEDTSYVFVTEDFGETWKDLSHGMNNPVRDIEEDPDNENVLYLATDYGLFVTVDRGENWVLMSEKAPDVIIMDLAIQERERDLAIGTYGRGIYLADIWPLKQMTAEVLEEDVFLFDVQRIVKWAMIERRGSSYGEFASTVNPPVGGNIYYRLKADAKSVKVLIKDPAGNLVREIRGSKSAGLQSVFWNLQKQAQEPEEGAQRRRRRVETADPGTYQAVLVVDDKEVAVRPLVVEEDPILLHP